MGDVDVELPGVVEIMGLWLAAASPVSVPRLVGQAHS